MDCAINVNLISHDPYIPFEEEETQELKNLVKAKYLEDLGKVDK